jgi:hypothetical protein
VSDDQDQGFGMIWKTKVGGTEGLRLFAKSGSSLSIRPGLSCLAWLVHAEKAEYVAGIIQIYTLTWSHFYPASPYRDIFSCQAPGHAD